MHISYLTNDPICYLTTSMKTLISFKEALRLTLSNVYAGSNEILPLHQLIGKILSEDIVSKVDCPSISSSRKDGYAVISKDVAQASEKTEAAIVTIEDKLNNVLDETRQKACTQCGTKLPKVAVFCWKCGAAV